MKNGIIKDFELTHVALIQKLQSSMSIPRFEHSQRVAALCVEFAQKNIIQNNTEINSGLELAWLAGISHDWCREFDVNDIFKLAEKSQASDILGNDALLMLNRKDIINNKNKWLLLHGLAAACQLHNFYAPNTQNGIYTAPTQSDFWQQLTQVYHAIAIHTLGTPHPNTLQKIMYIADSLEPHRTLCTESERQNILSDKISLDLQLIKVIELKKQKYNDLDSTTLLMLKNIAKRNNYMLENN